MSQYSNSTELFAMEEVGMMKARDIRDTLELLHPLVNSLMAPPDLGTYI